LNRTVAGATSQHLGLELETLNSSARFLGALLWGGVVLAYRKSVFEGLQAEAIHELAGREVAVTFSRGEAKLVIAAVHFQPNAVVSDTRSRLQRLAAAVGNSSANLKVLLGDWNFTIRDEHRLVVGGSQAEQPMESAARIFEEVFSNFVEIEQPCMTRREREPPDVGRVSRIDRIYVEAMAADLLDDCFRSHVVCSVMEASLPSDHVPVALTISRPCSSPPCRATIPDWIVGHPDFARFCGDLIFEDDLVEDPCQRVIEVTELMHAAARKAKLVATSSGAKSEVEQIHWLLVLLRSARSRSTSGVRKALAALPFDSCFASLAHGSIQVDTPKVQARIQTLQYNAAEEELARLDAENQGAEASRSARATARREKAWRKKLFWRPTGRRIAPMTITRDDGTALGNPVDCVAALSSFWGGLQASTLQRRRAAPSFAVCPAFAFERCARHRSRYL